MNQNTSENSVLMPEAGVMMVMVISPAFGPDMMSPNTGVAGRPIVKELKNKQCILNV